MDYQLRLRHHENTQDSVTDIKKEHVVDDPPITHPFTHLRGRISILTCSTRSVQGLIRIQNREISRKIINEVIVLKGTF